MSQTIRRVSSIKNHIVTFYGPAEPREVKDKSAGLLHEYDWAIVSKDGAYPLEAKYFPQANGILEIK